ncbi:MAG: hypothetical protein R2755_24065 [Acidimicrobiales bacterium]
MFTLADRVRPRRLVLLGTLGAALANVALLAAGGIGAGLPLRFAVGAFLAWVYPPAPQGDVGVVPAGSGAGAGGDGGRADARFGPAPPHPQPGSPPWEAVIVATSALTVLGGLVMELAATDGPFLAASARVRPAPDRPDRAQPALRLASAGYFGHMWELYAMWAWFGAFSADVLPGRPSLAALLTFAVIGIGAAGCVVGGVISDRSTRTAAAALAMALSAPVAAVIGFGATARWRWWSCSACCGGSGWWPTRRSSRRSSPSTPTRATWARR